MVAEKLDIAKIEQKLQEGGAISIIGHAGPLWNRIGWSEKSRKEYKTIRAQCASKKWLIDFFWNSIPVCDVVIWRTTPEIEKVENYYHLYYRAAFLEKGKEVFSDYELEDGEDSPIVEYN